MESLKTTVFKELLAADFRSPPGGYGGRARTLKTRTPCYKSFGCTFFDKWTFLSGDNRPADHDVSTGGRSVRCGEHMCWGRRLFAQDAQPTLAQSLTRGRLISPKCNGIYPGVRDPVLD